MNQMILIFLLCCGLSSIKDTPTKSVWSFIDSGSIIKNGEKHSINSDSIGLIPFLWKEVRYSALDSMLLKSGSYDSLMNEYTLNVIDYPPEPIIIETNNMTIGYSQQKSINERGCKFNVYIFYVNLGNEITSHNTFQFYYIEKFGIFGAVHMEQLRQTFEWDRYTMTDLQNVKGISIVDKKELQVIYEKSLDW